MFLTLKKELNIVEVLEYVTDSPYKTIGENTFAPEDDICPSCQHSNCFRVKHEGINEESFAKCFSENIVWDVVSIVAKLKEITNVGAAKLLAKHYNVKLPNDYSPVQEVHNLAANYYHELLYSSGPHAELNGLTPEEYQLQIRQHTKESLNQFQIGWSDGKLVEYLEAVGVSEEIIKASGLAGKKGDFLPAKTFIYPHFIKGRVSHWTFKDVLKQKEFQLPSRYKLSGHTYYNSDSISKEGPVAILEGENDCISLTESDWSSGVICCNGSISASQLEWLTINLKGRDIVTFYDIDPAGDIYREKTEKLRKHFKSLLHVKVTGACKDIDEFLKKGGDLSALLESAQQQATNIPSSVEVENSDTEPGDVSHIVIKDGAYHKVVYKEGNESLRQLTNFTIELRNTYIRDDELEGEQRDREITISLVTGKKSKPFMVNSAAKTTLKTFKTLVANAADASFYGTEADLTSIWEKVYQTNIEKEVNLVAHAGRVDKFSGWIFRDCFIADSGALYYPDENGIMWVTTNAGLKPVSVEAGSDDKQQGIPSICSHLPEDEQVDLIGIILKAIALNIGDMGEALTIMGYCWATIHSKTLFNHMRCFPHFAFHGIQGQGKTTLIKLMLSIFNMEAAGYTTISNLNSGVAFARKMSHFISLPMAVDELRSDQLASEWSSSFRSWYDRSSRTVGAKNNKEVTVSPVRTTTIFAGEDLFTDPATRARCIPVRIRRTGRETVKSFKIMEKHWGDLNAIGYHWILDYGKIGKTKLIEELDVFTEYLKTNGVEGRQARNWAAVAIFATKLNKEYCPEYNYMAHLAQVAIVDLEKQREDSTLSQFWEFIEGLQSEENAVITSDHMKREGNLLHIWFKEVYNQFERRSSQSSRSKFSIGAIMAAIKEEEYFVSDFRGRIGMSNIKRRGITLDLTKAGETIQTLAEFLDN